MFARFIQETLRSGYAGLLAHLKKAPARHPVRWCSGIVVLVIAATVFALLARRDSASAAGKEPPPSSHVEVTREGPEPPLAEEPDRPRQTPEPEPAGTTPDPRSLETIGTLGAAHYFEAYLNIGLVADAKAKGTYTDADARKVLRSVLSLVESVDRQLEKFGHGRLEKEDRDSLKQMRAISALLRDQGRELQTYWDSFQEQDAARYENLRQSCYAAISKLMAIAP